MSFLFILHRLFRCFYFIFVPLPLPVGLFPSWSELYRCIFNGHCTSEVHRLLRTFPFSIWVWGPLTRLTAIDSLIILWLQGTLILSFTWRQFVQRVNASIWKWYSDIKSIGVSVILTKDFHCFLKTIKYRIFNQHIDKNFYFESENHTRCFSILTSSLIYFNICK